MSYRNKEKKQKGALARVTPYYCMIDVASYYCITHIASCCCIILLDHTFCIIHIACFFCIDTQITAYKALNYGGKGEGEGEEGGGGGDGERKEGRWKREEECERIYF